MSKAAKSVSIIGGSDGPTSVFLVGNKYKEKNLFKRLENTVRMKRHQHRLAKARKSIRPGAHTLSETICYIKEHYGMVEADSTYPFYEENIRNMRFSLIQREQIDLLPKLPELKEFQDKEMVGLWQKEFDEWQKQSEAIVEKVPQEILNMDYHLFVLDKGEAGSMQVETEMNRGLIAMQYSGRGFDPILKDIYLYYGVSEEDILNKTERYQNLVSTLAY